MVIFFVLCLAQQVMVSMMLTYQPFYIGGIEDLENAKSNAYGGVGCFLLVFFTSVVCLVVDALRGGGIDGDMRESRHSRGAQYESVPTSGIGGSDLMMDSEFTRSTSEQRRFT
jgi:hypothetical protein